MKIFFLAVILFLSLVLVSCQKNIETGPKDEVKQTYTITFEEYNFFIADMEITEGEKIYFPDIDDQSSKVKYWTIKGETSIFDEKAIINSDLTLTPVREFANRISFANTDLEDIYVYSGEKIIVKKEPVKANYIFDGWYKDYAKTTLFDFDKPLGDVQNLNVYAKWKDAHADLYYIVLKSYGIIYYEIYITDYATEVVTVPNDYLGKEIYEVYRYGEINNAITINLPSTITNALPGFFMSSPNLEEIIVEQSNRIYQSVEGVLYRSQDAIIYYPSNKAGDVYATNAGYIESNAFANTRNLKHLFLNEAFDVHADAFKYSSIENIVVKAGANYNYNAFRNYKGNIFLNELTYDFRISEDIHVYLKGEWSLIDGLPVAN